MSYLGVLNRATLDEIRSGDVLLFTNNTHSGLLLRVACSSFWTHTGIALRIKTSRNGQLKITTDGSGEVYVMEIDSKPRYELYTQSLKSGFGITPIKHLSVTQTIMAVRRMKDEFRTEEFSDLTFQFIEKYINAEFPKNFKPFLGVWLEIPLAGMGMRYQNDNVEFFCSEMMAYYYLYLYTNVRGVTSNQTFLKKDLYAKEVFDKGSKRPMDRETHREELDQSYFMARIFGPDAPNNPEFIAPHHFDTLITPHAPMFELDIKILHRCNETVSKAIALPLVLTIAIVFLIWLSLPDMTWDHITTDTSKETRTSMIRTTRADGMID